MVVVVARVVGVAVGVVGGWAEVVDLAIVVVTGTVTARDATGAAVVAMVTTADGGTAICKDGVVVETVDGLVVDGRVAGVVAGSRYAASTALLRSATGSAPGATEVVVTAVGVISVEAGFTVVAGGRATTCFLVMTSTEAGGFGTFRDETLAAEFKPRTLEPVSAAAVTIPVIATSTTAAVVASAFERFMGPRYREPS